MKRKNHTFFILDASGSMSSLGEKPVTCLQKLQKNIDSVDDSTEVDTLFSIYLFGSKQDCVQFETKRFELNFASYQDFMDKFGGGTRLYASVHDALRDARKICTLYGDHAYLYYVITDGGENCGGRYSDYKDKITSRDTIVYLVPSANNKAQMIAAGVPADCIDVWDLSARGLEEATERFTESYKNYNVLRTQGVTSTSSYFKLDTNLTKKTVAASADKLSKKAYTIIQNNAKTAQMIRPLVESTGKSYNIGRAYYELVKKETVQAQKDLILVSKKDGTAYHGKEVRKMLGLPDYEVKIQPGDFGDWYIYVQSTSVNRNVIPNQTVLVL